MTTDAWLTLGIIVALFGALIWGRLPTWVVFVCALAAIITLDLAPESDALGGFSNSGVLSVVVLFVVAEGMYRTGAISMLISRVVGLPPSERAANVRIQPITAAGSAFLNNTPIVAMLIPVIGDLGRSARLQTSRIYMGVSHASVLGGASTLIGTSTNLIIAGLVATTYGVDLGIFFPTLVGLPAAIAGIVFMLVVADRLLGRRRADEAIATAPPIRYRADLAVIPGSRLVGRTLAETGLATPSGARLLAITRAGETTDEPGPDWRLEAGDGLAYDATPTGVGDLWTTIGLVAANPPTVTGTEYAQHLDEAVVAVDGPWVGKPVAELELGTRKVIGVSRGGSAVPGTVAETTLQAGDLLMLQEDEEDIERPDPAIALVRRVPGYRVQRTDRAIYAGVIVLAMVLLAAFGVMSMLNAALLASIALVATGCITMRAAFRAIDWQTYVVLACAVGLEPAMTQSGLADVLADGLASLAGSSMLIALTVVFLGTILLTNLVTNSAAAALMFPIAASIAAGFGADWDPFIVVLMLGCSYAFINPAGFQTHLMVMKPGRYTFGDFAKVGVPLTIVLGVVAIGLTAVIYGV
jgi:di/tricarboxylate transporter